MSDSRITVRPVDQPAADPKEVYSLSTSWLANGARGSVHMVPQLLLVPVYHKVRITFESVISELMAFEELLLTVLPALNSSFEWDVYIIENNDLKREIRASSEWDHIRRKFLEMPLPRFMWRARALLGTRVSFDVLFDATGIETGDFCIAVAEIDSRVGDMLRDAAADPVIRRILTPERWWHIVSKFVSG
jgi:hypothetical protein